MLAEGRFPIVIPPMKLARQASALLLWAAISSRGLFAQGLPASPESLQLRGVELRYVLPELLFNAPPPPPPVKALYVNAWAFGSIIFPTSSRQGWAVSLSMSLIFAVW